MITPRAVEQRRRDVNGQLRPNDSKFEWVRWSERSDESTDQGVALDTAIASRGGKIVQVAPFQRSRTRRADRGSARRHVVQQYKLHFVNRHLTYPVILWCVCEIECYRP